MLKYTIKNIDFQPHDLDQEIIYFNFEIHVSEPNKVIIESSYPLSKLLNFIKNDAPEFYKFWTITRQSTGEWGPAENSTLDALGTEALAQIYTLLEKHLINSNHIEAVYNHHVLNMQKPDDEQLKTHENASKLLAVFQDFESEIKESNHKYSQFCTKVEKQVRDIALNIFPEINDLEPQKLIEYTYIYRDGIVKMYDDLEKFLKK